MKVNTTTVLNKVKALYFSTRECNTIKEILSIIKLVGKDYLFGINSKNIKESLKITN